MNTLTLESLYEMLLNSRDLVETMAEHVEDVPGLRPIAWRVCEGGLSLGHIINKFFPDSPFGPLSPDDALGAFVRVKIQLLRDYPMAELTSRS